MNAVSLYVSTCRMVFQSCADDSSAWADIYRLLSYLRQALTCCVCGKLLMIPLSSKVSTCQHCVCKNCIGGKMRLKPPCPRCSNYDTFTENIQLRIVLQCYKKLCEYLNGSVLHRKWANLNGGTSVNFGDIIQEGSEFSDEFRYLELSELNSADTSLQFGSNMPSLPIDGDPTLNSECVLRNENINGDTTIAVTNGNSSLYRVSVEGRNATKIMIKRTATDSLANELPNIETLESVTKRMKANGSGSSLTFIKNIKQKKKGCRCGMATPNPGKLTCCGQRCPCYVENSACTECRCRGCRNPHKLYTNDQLLASNNQIPIEVDFEIVTEDIDSKNLSSEIASDIN